MATYTYDDALFRQQFAAFANTTTYPAATLAMYWGFASEFISSSDGPTLAGNALVYALNLLTAHIAKSNDMINAGIDSVLVSGSSEGSVSVSLTPPPAKTAWQWWMATTPYGSQLRALLRGLAPLSQSVGGSLERASFRKAGGVF